MKMIKNVQAGTPAQNKMECLSVGKFLKKTVNPVADKSSIVFFSIHLAPFFNTIYKIFAPAFEKEKPKELSVTFAEIALNRFRRVSGSCKMPGIVGFSRIK